MHDDLDGRIGEHLPDRARALTVQRVEDHDLGPVVALDHELHQAQQRPIAALGDKLGVEPDASLRARALGELLERGARAHPTSAYR